MDSENFKEQLYSIYYKLPKLAWIGIAAVIVIALIAFFMLPMQGTSNITVLVQDELDNPIDSADLTITYSGQTISGTTNANGEYSLQLPLNTFVGLEVSKDDFESATRSFQASEESMVYGVNLISLISAEMKRITLTRPDGSLLEENATVTFSCSNPGVQAPSQQTVSSGVVEVSANPNCGNLLVNVDSSNYKTLSSREVSSNSETIYLSEYEIETGRVKVLAADAEGNPLSGMEVSLFGENGDLILTQTLYGGESTFENIVIGSYYVSVNDPNGQYALQQSSRQQVSRNQTTVFSIAMSKSIKGSIEVNVFDADNNAEIDNANVKLYYSNEATPRATQNTGTNQEIRFNVTDTGEYRVVAEHDDYLFGSETINLSSGTHTINLYLEKLTPDNSGRLVVKVRDEDGKLVEAAKVFLFDATTDFLYPVDPEVTDANGEAVFTGVESGTYYVKAVKGLMQAKTENKTINVREESRFVVSLVRGQATLQVNVLGPDNQAVPFSEVEIIPIGEGQANSLITDNQGVTSLSLKAGTRVYVRVSKEGYSSWTSVSFPLLSGELTELNAELNFETTGRHPAITFSGLFETETSEEELDELEAGNTYFARLKVVVPKDYDYNTLGVHLRVGKQALLANDNIYIKDIETPNAVIVKGTSFNPPAGFLNDESNLTFGNAKWVNIILNGVREGTYNIGVEVVVKPEVVSGDEIPFYYRAWGEAQGEFLRDPIDSELGTAVETSSKQELYAETYKRVFWEGIPALCTDEFCYSGERIFDTVDRLYRKDPYTLTVFAPHTLVFELTNNSDRIHDNAEIRIRNIKTGEETNALLGNSLEFNSYSFVNADAQVYSGDGLADFELDPLLLGNFSKNKSVRAELEFTPKQEGESAFELTVVSNGNEVFRKVINVTVIAEREMQLLYEPTTIGAFSGTELRMSAADLQGNAIRDVRIDVFKLTTSNEKIRIGEIYTNASGNALFELPSSTPNSKFLIEGKKPNYKTEAITLSVKGEVVSFNPDSFIVDLKLLGLGEAIAGSEATNLIAPALKIKNIDISGYFKGLLDEGSMLEYSRQFIGTELIQNQEKDLDLFKGILTEGISIQKTEELEGNLEVLLESQELGKTWGITLPFTANVEVGQGVEAEQCLIIEGVNVPNWETISQGETISIEFELYNRCKANSVPVSLQNLAGTVEWESNTIGNVQLEISNLETGESLTELLREGEKISYFGRMQPDSVYLGRLSFTPKPGHIGEKAEFNVKVSGEVPTTQGLQEIASNKDVEAAIDIVDFRDCIKFTPQSNLGARIESSEQAVKFKIDTTECHAPLDIRLCHGSGNCEEGTEGGILVRPMLETNLQGEKEFEVQRLDISGLYGIYVEARAPGGSYSYVDTMDVIVEPKVGREFFSLDRYDFTLIGEGAVDSVTLYNNSFQEEIAVTADACAWGRASNNLSDAQIAGISTGAGVIGFGIAYAGAAYALSGVSTAVISAATASVMIPVIGIVVGVAIIAVTAIVLVATGEDCHDKMLTYTLVDYVMDLTRDRKDVHVSDQLINADWMTDVSLVYADEEKIIQEVGLTFENQGIEQLEPLYGIVTLRSIEHLHGDPSHSGQAAVTCRTGTFSRYKIGSDSNSGFCQFPEDETYVQKMHVRFKTAEQPQGIPPTDFDVFDCSSGVLTGRTGEGALPNIKLNWSWNNIGMNDCDYPDGFYCDATQFSIALSKRIDALDEFLQANNYSFTCPEEPADTAEGQNNQDYSNEVPEGQIGFNEIKTEFDTFSNDANAIVTIANKTEGMQTTDVLIELHEFTGDAESSLLSVLDSCDVRNVEVEADSNKEVSCSFEGLQQGTYYVSSNLSSLTTNDVNDWEPIAALIAFGDPSVEGEDCWLLKTTGQIGGNPVIDQFVEATPNVQWTNEVPNIDALNDLLQFDVMLMKDGYTNDFRQDFVNYYSQKNFADTPNFFYNPGSQRNQLMDYFLDEEKMTFTRRYVPGNNRLPTGGIYKIELASVFGDDWQYYKEGDPNANIIVSFYHFDDPVPNSPFYSMPLDGLVGLEGESFERQGYGSQFENMDEHINISDSLIEGNLESFEDAGSNAVQEVKTDIVEDFRKLNSDPSSRGVLMQLRNTGLKEKALKFSPSYATPVMLKVSHDYTREPFHAYYAVSVNGSPIDTGQTLTYWEGAGQCLDFSGLPVVEAFDYKPDRAATNRDRILQWQSSYAVDWQQAVLPGDVYLRTIFYTPSRQQSTLNMLSTQNALFVTPDTSGQTVSLNGILGMPYNGEGSARINSLQDVFDLVKQRKVCVTNTGIDTKYWWNPKAIYTQTGSQENIHVLTEQLNPKNDACIGYSS